MNPLIFFLSDIMNQKGQQAWELYLKMGTSSDSFSLLQLIANDCYKVESSAGCSAVLPCLTEFLHSLYCHFEHVLYLNMCSAQWYGYLGWVLRERLRRLRMMVAMCSFRWASSTTLPKRLMLWRSWTRALITGRANEGHVSASFSSYWQTRSLSMCFSSYHLLFRVIVSAFFVCWRGYDEFLFRSNLVFFTSCLHFREKLKEVLVLLRNSGNPQVEYIIRAMRKWAKDNRVLLS